MNLKRIIREELNDLQWIEDTTPTLSEVWSFGLIKKGDVLTLSGYLLGNDHVLDDTGIYVDDFKIEIDKVGNKDTPSANSYFIPLQEKYWDYLGFSKTNNPNRKSLSFSRKDGDMLVMNHTSNGTNK